MEPLPFDITSRLVFMLKDGQFLDKAHLKWFRRYTDKVLSLQDKPKEKIEIGLKGIEWAPKIIINECVLVDLLKRKQVTLQANKILLLSWSPKDLEFDFDKLILPNIKKIILGSNFKWCVRLVNLLKVKFPKVKYSMSAYNSDLGDLEPIIGSNTKITATADDSLKVLGFNRITIQTHKYTHYTHYEQWIEKIDHCTKINIPFGQLYREKQWSIEKLDIFMYFLDRILGIQYKNNPKIVFYFDSEYPTIEREYIDLLFIRLEYEYFPIYRKNGGNPQIKIVSDSYFMI